MLITADVRLKRFFYILILFSTLAQGQFFYLFRYPLKNVNSILDREKK